jgi:hypothetical protein
MTQVSVAAVKLWGSHNDAVSGLSRLLFHGQAILLGLLKTEA